MEKRYFKVDDQFGKHLATMVAETSEEMAEKIRRISEDEFQSAIGNIGTFDIEEHTYGCEVSVAIEAVNADNVKEIYVLNIERTFLY